MTRAKYFMVFCTLALGCLLVIQAEAAKPRTEQEEYVRQQVKAGQKADLLDKFVLTDEMDKEQRDLARRKGLIGYLAYLGPRERQDFLNKYEENLQIGAGFLEDFLRDLLKGDHKGVIIKNAIIKNLDKTKKYNNLDLRSLIFPFEVEFSNCFFDCDVNFRDCEFEKNLRLEGSHFAGEAFFVNMKVKKSAYFKKTIFEGKVINFGGIEIGISLNMDKTKFKSEGIDILFNSSKIDKNANFIETEFSSPFEFCSAFVGGKLVFGAKNDDPTKFYKKVNFSYSNIGSYFSLRNAEVNGDAFFDDITVKKSAIFQNVKFKNQVKFSNADIGLDFDAKGAQFLGPVYMQFVKVDRNLTLDPLMESNKVTTFQELVSFTSVDIGGQFSAREINLSENPLIYFNRLHVGEIATKENFKDLLILAEKSSFKDQNYLWLEKCCTRAGHQDWADEAYIAMRNRELAQMAWYNPEKWPNKIFWGWLFGYGRSISGGLLVIWLCWIIIGMVYFDPAFCTSNDWIQRAKSNSYKKFFVRFLLSVDRFIPGVDLGIAKAWNPRNQVSSITWAYWYLHQLLGWILIPIIFAFILSKIKP